MLCKHCAWHRQIKARLHVPCPRCRGVFSSRLVVANLARLAPAYRHRATNGDCRCGSLRSCRASVAHAVSSQPVYTESSLRSGPAATVATGRTRHGGASVRVSAPCHHACEKEAAQIRVINNACESGAKREHPARQAWPACAQCRAATCHTTRRARASPRASHNSRRWLRSPLSADHAFASSRRGRRHSSGAGMVPLRVRPLSGEPPGGHVR
jgi:hypothetical protein